MGDGHRSDLDIDGDRSDTGESDIVRSVRAWLKGGGYPLEMWAAARMSEHGFLPNQSQYFQDPHTQLHRELDIVATQMESISRDGRIIGSAAWHVIVECKSTQDPWVAFVDTAPRFGSSALRMTTLLGHHLVMECERQFHLGCALDGEVAAYGLVRRRPSGKSKTDRDEEEGDLAFAIMKKLAVAAQVEVGNLILSVRSAKFVYPILVLDAPLLSAGLREDGSLDVREVQSATVVSPPGPEGGRISVLVVTRGGFIEVLEKLRVEIDTLRRVGRSRLPEISQHLEQSMK